MISSKESTPSAGEHKNMNKQLQQTTTESKMNLLKRLDRKIPAFGFLLAVFSSIFYVTTTLMVKLTPNFNTTVMVVIRCFFQTILYALPILYQGQSLLSDKEMNFMLIIRGLISYVCMVSNYAALRLIPFGDATSIAQSAPIYTGIIAFLWLGESFSLLQVFCVFTSIGGVVAIAKPAIVWQVITDSPGSDSAFHSQTIEGTLYAFFSAIVLSACYVIVRKLHRVPVMVILFWFSLGCLICGCVHLAYMRIVLNDLSVRWPENSHEWLCTMTSSLVGVTGQLMLNLALKVEEAGPVSLARTCEILLSFSLQVLILKNEPLELSSLLGALAILTSIVLIALRRWALDGNNPPQLLIILFRTNRKDQKVHISTPSTVPLPIVHVMHPEREIKSTSS